MSAPSAPELPVPALPEWLAAAMPFQRRVLQLGGRALHTVDHGDGPPVLLVHGNPTWSYLWRKVLPPLIDAGLRVVAPDLLGLGLSEKLPKASDHTLARHIRTICQLADQLELDEVTVVGQDWGGPIVSGAAAHLGERARAAVFGNTALLSPRRPVKATAFHHFSHVPLLSDLVFRGLRFPVPFLSLAQGDRGSIARQQRRAYMYPFRRFADGVAPLALARMVPHRDDHPSLEPLEAVDRWYREFPGPISLVWGRRDPLLARAVYRLQKTRPDATVIETDAGHFLQEEVPDTLAEQIIRVSNSARR